MQGSNSGLTEDILVLGGSIEVASGGVIDTAGKTLGEIAQEISEQGNVSASIQDGKFTIKSENGEVSIVAQGDFARVSGMGSFTISQSENVNEGTFIEEVQRLTEAEAIAQGYTIIKTAQDLDNIRNNVDADGNVVGKYILMNDIDLSAYDNWEPIGDKDNSFSGIFDGNGYIINNLTINRTEEYIGLFGHVTNAEIKNVGLDKGNVSGYNYIGAIVGYAESGSNIKNCYATCKVTGYYKHGDYRGGLVGINLGTISNSYATGDVTQSNGVGDLAGGLVGRNIGTIMNCFATGAVYGFSMTGGLVGENTGTITQSYSTGSVTGHTMTGGLVGENRGSGATISDCYTTGSVAGDENIGGLVGWNFIYNPKNGGGIYNSYATGSVYGNDDPIGGLVGRDYDIDTYQSFWNKETSGQTTSTGGKGLTSEQFADKSIFIDAGWDEAIWDFSGSTPTLKNTYSKNSSSTITGSVNTNNLTDNYFWGQTDGQLAFSNGVIVSIAATDSRSDVIQKINDSGLSASINSDGKIQITADGVSDLTVTSDSSGFSDFYGLDGAESSYNGSISTSTETIPDPDGGDVTDPDGGDGGNTTDPGNPDGGDSPDTPDNPDPPLDIAGLVTHGVSNIRLQIGKDGSDLSALFCDTTFIFDDFSLDFSDEDSCANSLEALEAFSDAVIKKQSDIGIYITRLESIYQSNSLKIQNTYSAYSTVMDADIAQETQKYVYNQIRQQTASSLLAQIQASRTQMVMTLLSSIM